MKLQKTPRIASIYLLTAFLLILGLFPAGCAERQAQAQAESETVAQVDALAIFADFLKALPQEKEETLSNGTVIRSRWQYRYQDCQLTITENVAYKRQHAPLGGFNTEEFKTAWESERSLPLAQIDLENLQQKGPYLRVHLLQSQNLIEEENHYTEAYLAYFQAENGQAHPPISNLSYNLISLPLGQLATKLGAIDKLTQLITHCQSR